MRTTESSPGTPQPPAPAAPADPVAAGLRIPIPGKPRRAGKHSRFVDSTDILGASAGAANIIMQLAWAPVGYGVVESRVDSGAVTKHPFKRARTTFTYLAVAMIGNQHDKDSYREAVNGVHRQVHSLPSSPVKYNALSRDLQLWVAMALYIGFEDTQQILRGRFSPEQRAEFYRGSETMGTSLQVTAAMWPASPEEFDRVWAERAAKIRIDPPVRQYLSDLAELRFLRGVPEPIRRFHREMTKGFLAPVFRDAMGWEWTPAHQRSFERTLRIGAIVNRITPGPISRLPYRLLLADTRWRARTNRPLV